MYFSCYITIRYIFVVVVLYLNTNRFKMLSTHLEISRKKRVLESCFRYKKMDNAKHLKVFLNKFASIILIFTGIPIINSLSSSFLSILCYFSPSRGYPKMKFSMWFKFTEKGSQPNKWFWILTDTCPHVRCLYKIGG
jgi:hypothetical protein